MVRSSTNRVVDLKGTINAIEKLLRQLLATGEDIDQSSLVRQTMRKFPHDIISKMEEIRKSENDWTMNELRDILWDVITTKERALNACGNTEAFNQQGVSGKSELRLLIMQILCLQISRFLFT